MAGWMTIIPVALKGPKRNTLISLLITIAVSAPLSIAQGLVGSGNQQVSSDQANTILTAIAQAAQSGDLAGGAGATAPARVGPLMPAQAAAVGEAALPSDKSEEKEAPPAEPSEFERYVSRLVGREVARYGSGFMRSGVRDFAVPSTTAVPPTYPLNVGDSLRVDVIGSISTSYDIRIDNEGNVFLPVVGRIALAGVQYGDSKKVLTDALATKFRNFELSVIIKELRGIRVYVTGFANSPGAYTIGSLSSLLNATFAAGGPSPGGSFRFIHLFRDGKFLAEFDLYQLARSGDKSGDLILKNEDVLYIPPVGTQVAVVGSVNEEAIYEAKTGESLATLVEELSGGFNSLADVGRVLLYRVEDLKSQGSRQLTLAELRDTSPKPGDIIRALSVGDVVQPLERQAVLVRIEGEVVSPGDYYVAPNTPLEEVISLAQGLTPRAYVFGTRLERLSVRQQQRESFLEAVEQLEIALAGAPLGGTDLQDPVARERQRLAAKEVLEKLKQKEPDGRVVLDLMPDSSSLPGDFVLENNDRIFIPPRAKTVGVFGAVYRAGSFELGRGGTIRQFLESAGGIREIADKREVFVVRANGAVVARHQGALDMKALPGDLIFVPVKTQSASLLARIREISTIIFQLGVTAAAINSVVQ